MRISQRGLALIKSFEGCLKPDGAGYFVPYICPAGVLTIGWGHTNVHGRQFDNRSRWTQAECDAALSEDLDGFESAVQRLVRVPLEQNEFDALVSFAYNCGSGNLAKSTLLKKLNAGDYAGAANEFRKWDRANGNVLRGLTRRRSAEAAMFRGSGRKDDGGMSADPMPQKADPPPPKDMTRSKTGWAALIAGIIAAIQGLKDQLSDLGLLDGFVAVAKSYSTLMLLIIIAAAIFIWWDRRRKLQEGV